MLRRLSVDASCGVGIDDVWASKFLPAHRLVRCKSTEEFAYVLDATPYGAMTLSVQPVASCPTWLQVGLKEPAVRFVFVTDASDWEVFGFKARMGTGSGCGGIVLELAGEGESLMRFVFREGSVTLTVASSRRLVDV
jgi:hypothetical protein